MTTRARRINVVFADDDDFAHHAFRRALTRSQVDNHVYYAKDGETAFELLRTLQQDAGCPTVLLTDLHMPRLDGLDLIREVRRDPALRSTIIYVLSSSDEPHDIRAAYNLAVAGYILKQDLDAEYMPFVAALEQLAQCLRFAGSLQH